MEGVDFSAAPSAAVMWWLAAHLELQTPVDVGWVRLPGIVPHPGRFEAPCAGCAGIVTVQVLPAPETAWMTLDEPADAFMCGQCPHCRTITWGTIPAADPGRGRGARDRRRGERP